MLFLECTLVPALVQTSVTHVFACTCPQCPAARGGVSRHKESRRNSRERRFLTLGLCPHTRVTHTRRARAAPAPHAPVASGPDASRGREAELRQRQRARHARRRRARARLAHTPHFYTLHPAAKLWSGASGGRRAGGVCCVGWHMLNNHFWLCGYTHAHATWPGPHTCTEPRCWRLRLTLTELSPLASVLRASQLQRRRPLKVSDARPPHTHYSALGTTRASALLPCPPPCSSPCSSSTAVVAAAAAAAARVLPSRPPPSRCRARQRQLATCAGSVW